MKLKWFEVQEFQSIRESGRVDALDITCLVGKNEAGKTALLRALYRLNPLVESEGKFDLTIDYPRIDVEDYRHDVQSGKRKVATPIRAAYTLDKKRAPSDKRRLWLGMHFEGYGARLIEDLRQFTSLHIKCRLGKSTLIFGLVRRIYRANPSSCKCREEDRRRAHFDHFRSRTNGRNTAGYWNSEFNKN